MVAALTAARQSDAVMTAEARVKFDIAGNEDSIETSRMASRRVWAPAIAGSAFALAGILSLLMLGSVIGLELITTGEQGFAISASAIGALYFVVAETVAFASGGYLAALMAGFDSDTIQTRRQRTIGRSLSVWSCAAVASVILGTSASAVSGTPANIGAMLGYPNVSAAAPADQPYWVALLFRPPQLDNRRADLAGVRFAQVDNGVQSDANTAPPPPKDQIPPTSDQTTGPQSEQGQDAGQYPLEPLAPSGLPRETVYRAQRSGNALSPDMQPPQATYDVKADKDEVGAILSHDLAKGGYLTTDDRSRIAELVARDAGIGYETATALTNSIQARIHNADAAARDQARSIAVTAQFWRTLALLLGALGSVFGGMRAGATRQTMATIAAKMRP